MEKIQVDILGLSSSPSAGGAYALLLKESFGIRRLPIIIGSFEAQSIALEIEGIKPPRPLTHDLMKNIVDFLKTNPPAIGLIIVITLFLISGTVSAQSQTSTESDSPEQVAEESLSDTADITAAESVDEEVLQ